MEVNLLQDIATVITFVAPGYFAIQIYSLIHSNRDRGFSRLLVESIVYSLPIVALSNLIWQNILNQSLPTLAVGYVMLLIGLALLTGATVALLRIRWPVKHLADWLHIEGPNSDFLKAELKRIDTRHKSSSAVTVLLKSGIAFSGTVESMSRYTFDGRPMYISFANVAWYDESTGKWDERKGNIIVSRDDIEYIETGKLADN